MSGNLILAIWPVGQVVVRGLRSRQQNGKRKIVVVQAKTMERETKGRRWLSASVMTGKAIHENTKALNCERCDGNWKCSTCLGIDDRIYLELIEIDSLQWFCEN